MTIQRLLQANAPLRKEASHRAEMTSQLLFGERFDILSENGDWVMVRGQHDRYEGWLEYKILCERSDEAGAVGTVTKPFAGIHYRDEVYLVPFGGQCPVYMLKHNANKSDFIVGALPVEQALDSVMSAFLRAPYLWGGRTVMGVDCSGLTQLYARLLGVELPRDAWQQHQALQAIPSFEGLRRGDLAFFASPGMAVTHTGICLGEGRILHASGRVRTDLLTSEGIINGQTGKLTHQMHGLARIV